jgi:urease accessory protein
MSGAAPLIAVVLVLSVVGPALAHDVVAGVGGFTGGLLHPLLVPVHLLALVGLGLLIGQQQGPSRRMLLAVFAAGLGAGLACVALAIGETPANLVLLAAAGTAGVLVVIAAPLPGIVGGIVAVTTGAAIGLDSPPDEISLWSAVLALLGTGLGAVVVLTAIVVLTGCCRREWLRIGVRVIGSWTAASAILVLATRLAR